MKKEKFKPTECSTCLHQFKARCSLNGNLVPWTGVPQWCNYQKPEEERIKCCENCVHYGVVEALSEYCLFCWINEHGNPTKWKDVHK